MFYGWSEAIEFGINGLAFILLYYIVAMIIFNRKNDKVLISGIIIIVYLLFITLISLDQSYNIYEFPGLYEVGVGFLNGLLFIPLLILCFIVDIITNVVRNTKKVQRNEDIKESTEVSEDGNVVEEKSEIEKTKKFFLNNSTIVTILVVISILFQFIFMAILSWWGTSGKSAAVVREAVKYEKTYDFKSEIEKLNEERYSDAVRNRVRYLYDEKLEELYNTGKYEECIELTILLDKNFGYDYDKDFYHSVKSGWGNPSRKSYVKLYEKALGNNDIEEMIKLKKKMIKVDSISYWKDYYGVSFDNLTKYDYMKYAEVGDIITLGKYYTERLDETKTKQDVEWIVYKIDNNKLHLASYYDLEEYNLKADDRYFNTSKLKEFLNDKLLHEIFSECEIELIENNNQNDYISIPEIKEVDIIKENRRNGLRDLKSGYIWALNRGQLTLLRDDNYADKQYALLAYDDTIHSFDEYFNREKKSKEYDVLILPTITINKTKIDNYVIKDINYKNENIKNISQSLKQQIVNKKTVKEYDENETVSKFDTMLFGKKSGEHFYQESVVVPYGTKNVDEYIENENRRKKKESQKYKEKTFANDEYFEWVILEKNDDKVLLLSKDVIHICCYQDYSTNSDYEQQKVSWENSEIRRYLNREFLNELFGEYEKDVILDTPIHDDKNPRFGTVNESNTNDKVFILSVDDCLKYFTDGNYELNDDGVEIKKSTASFDNDTKKSYLDLFYGYEKEKENAETARYWLIDLGEQFWNACYVDKNGAINTRGEYVKNGKIGYRPAIWVNLAP